MKYNDPAVKIWPGRVRVNWQSFFFGLTGNRDRKFRYCSRIYVRNWFTLLNEQNLLLDFEGTRFVNEQSILKKK
jgi:hypothetical protein